MGVVLSRFLAPVIIHRSLPFLQDKLNFHSNPFKISFHQLWAGEWQDDYTHCCAILRITLPRDELQHHLSWLQCFFSGCLGSLCGSCFFYPVSMAITLARGDLFTLFYINQVANYQMVLLLFFFYWWSYLIVVIIILSPTLINFKLSSGTFFTKIILIDKVS